MAGFDKLKNQYEVKRTIRFNLTPVHFSYKKISSESFESKLKEFVSVYGDVIDSFKRMMFIEEYGEISLNRDIHVRHEWMKIYAKQDFHLNKEIIVRYRKNRKGENIKSNTDTSLEKTPFIFDLFNKFLMDNLSSDDYKDGILSNLEVIIREPLDEKSGKSNLSYLLNKIQKRSNFEFIYQLFKNMQSKKSDFEIEECKKKLDRCKELLLSLNHYLTPKNSSGLEVERTSLNYFTVNKKPKDYKGEKKRIYDKKNIPINNRVLNGNQSKYNEVLKESGFYNRYNKKNFSDFSLEEFYKNLKEFKAEEKSKFFELINFGASLNRINEDIPLFELSDIERGKNKELSFDSFQKETEKIKKLSDDLNGQLNDTLKKEIKELKIKRGRFFNVNDDENCPFQRYITYTKLYRDVAMEYGRIKADTKNLEKEEINAERLASWSVFVKIENGYFLMTIPKHKDNHSSLSSAYYDLKDTKSVDGEYNIYITESLTLRALEKLCFGLDKNTFVNEDFLEELNMLSPEYIVHKDGKKSIKRKDEILKESELKLINFYKKVLSMITTKKRILINDFKDNSCKDNYLSGDIKTLRDFQIALEKKCFTRKEVRVSKDFLNDFRNKYSAKLYKITSFDLEKRRENPESHTNLWEIYWTQSNEGGYTTRINPEMRINFIDKREESIKDKSGNEVERNRRKDKEFILSLTITEHNDKPKFDMAFADKKKVIKNINDFNTTLNSKLQDGKLGIYYYGLDRGEAELVTLGAFKFLDEIVKVDTGCLYNKPKAVKIDVWELPEDKLMEQVPYETKSGTMYFDAYKNISKCEHLLIKKETESCMDLSCAKVINGKIVLNGDISTLINLKLENAKRRINNHLYDFMKAKYKKDGKVDIRIEYKEKTKNKPERFDLYINNGEFKELGIYYPKFAIEKKIAMTQLDQYIVELRDIINNQKSVGLNIELEKVNHLRDAISSNIVGILNFLYKDFPGFISLENLETDDKNEKLGKSKVNLASRIEYKLLNKFKTLGLVPPNYKMVMSLQSKRDISQLGILNYIETSGTSSNCPHCGQSINDKEREENKWRNHQFRCSHCGFSSYENEDHKGLDFLNSSDDIAAYNIAKRGLEYINSLKK